MFLAPVFLEYASRNKIILRLTFYEKIDIIFKIFLFLILILLFYYNKQ